MTYETITKTIDAMHRAFESENWEGVIEACNEIIAQDPLHDKIYSRRGRAHAELANYAQAADDFTMALKHEADNPQLYTNRALAYFYLQNMEASISDFTAAIKLAPDDAESYYMRGCIYLNGEDIERAIEDFSKCVLIDPQHARAYGNRGNCYDVLGQYDKAIEDFDKAIEADPNDLGAYFNRGNEYSNLNQYERAIEDYDKALELEPMEENALRNRANAFEKSGLYEKAVQDCTELIRMESAHSPFAYQLRAECYEKLGKPDLAEADRSNADESALLALELQQQMAMDEELLNHLSSMGASLNVVREIDHGFICPSDQLNGFIAELEKLAFTIDPVGEPDEEDDTVWIDCHEQAAPNEMRERTVQLVRLAFKFGAQYDGWGTVAK